MVKDQSKHNPTRKLYSKSLEAGVAVVNYLELPDSAFKPKEAENTSETAGYSINQECGDAALLRALHPIRNITIHACRKCSKKYIKQARAASCFQRSCTRRGMPKRPLDLPEELEDRYIKAPRTTSSQSAEMGSPGAGAGEIAAVEAEVGSGGIQMALGTVGTLSHSEGGQAQEPSAPPVGIQIMDRASKGTSTADLAGTEAHMIIAAGGDNTHYVQVWGEGFNTMVKTAVANPRHHISKGGFGIVVRVNMPGSGEVVAVKVPEGTNSASHKEFTRMAQLTAVGHPNIVPMKGVVFKDNVPCIIMEEYKDGSLGRYLEDRHGHRKEFTSGAHLLRVVTDVANGVAFMHSQNIVHGDLKPDNCLTDGSGGAMVCDFGLSQLLHQTRKLQLRETTQPHGLIRYYDEERPCIVLTGTAPGTPGYIADEGSAGSVALYLQNLRANRPLRLAEAERLRELERHRLTAYAAYDVFSLGCILLEMALGKHIAKIPAGEPVMAKSIVDFRKLLGRDLVRFARQHTNGRAPLLTLEMPDDVRQRYLNLCKQCLACGPAARPHAHQVVDELRLLSGMLPGSS